MSRQIDVTQYFFQTLSSVYNEFGDRNVLLSVPLEWEELASDISERQRSLITFTTEDKVTITAFRDGVRNFHMELDASLLIKEFR